MMLISIPKAKARAGAFSATITPDSRPRPRPAVILPGLGNNSTDYQKLQAHLLDNHGIPTAVPAISRADWLRNAAGLADPNYWRGTLTPRPILDWYLNRLHQAVSELTQSAGQQQLSLIGHSAGGWLARLYLEEYGYSNISLLLTLGTPHMPPPKGASGVIDQTRGLLNYVQTYCPQAVYTPNLKYVCIAGRYIKGERLLGNSLVSVDGGDLITKDQAVGDVTVMNRSTTFGSRLVGQGYKQVCGQADVWGDGVVPEISAHLEGALNITLDGVYHSPVGSDDTLRPWYGSPAVVDQWVHHLLN